MALLQPKKVKYRRHFRGKIKGPTRRGAQLAFGEYGLKALAGGLLSSRQIEAARKAITHHTKRGGKLWIRIFPDKPITRKPAEVRMGGGKGAVDHYAAVIRPGRILFELSGVGEAAAREALRRAAHKLSLKTEVAAREV